jgi:signal recognition particle GTPase
VEAIALREFKHPEQMRVQERIAKSVTANPDRFIEKYIKLPNSFSGKYVCSDLFKEVFPEYNSSREARGFFNTVVHNSAAVLASEQFKRLTSQRASEGMVLMFLTGVSGAGKTTHFLAAQKELGDKFYAVFEGRDRNRRLQKFHYPSKLVSL